MFTASKKEARGFTLLELLIVIGIIAILATILIVVLNPVETLKKSRDVQRMSDLNTLKTALGLVLTSSSTPYLSQISGVKCLSGAADAVIAYSSEIVDVACSGDPTEGTKANGTFAVDACWTKGTTGASAVDGTGWLPVNFDWLPGGSPISNLPLDPVNDPISATPGTAHKVYRYICQSTGASGKPSNVFELGAVLESDAYTVDDKKMEKDGGDSTSYYEVGTNLKLVASGY